MNMNNNISKTIYEQLLGTTDINIIFSWGAQKFRADSFNEMEALRFKVDARLFKGDVIIAYNAGADTYEIHLKKDGDEPELLRDDVYFDEMGRIIDEAIELGTDEKEYEEFVKGEYAKLLVVV